MSHIKGEKKIYILFIQSRFYLVLVKAAMTCQQFIAKVTQGCPLADPMKSKCVKIPVVHSLEIKFRISLF